MQIQHERRARRAASAASARASATMASSLAAAASASAASLAFASSARASSAASTRAMAWSSRASVVTVLSAPSCSAVVSPYSGVSGVGTPVVGRLGSGEPPAGRWRQRTWRRSVFRRQRVQSRGAAGEVSKNRPGVPSTQLSKRLRFTPSTASKTGGSTCGQLCACGTPQERRLEDLR